MRRRVNMSHKTVKARFWPWISVESPEHFSRRPPFARGTGVARYAPKLIRNRPPP